MRNRFAVLAAMVAVVSLAESPAFAAAKGGDEGFGGNVGLVLGQKTLHENEFGSDLKTQTGLQVMTSWGEHDWPVWIAADLGYNSGSKSGATATETELSLGARKFFRMSDLPIRPYVGLGVQYGTATLKFGGSSNSASGFGLWGDGGAQWMFGPIGVGADLRYDSCPVSKNGVKADIGGLMVGIAGSFSF